MIELAKQNRRIADVLIGLLLFLYKNFHNAGIAANLLIVRAYQHIPDVRRFFLTVSVDTAVSLLKHHQRPRNIKVNQPMRQIMQINSFGSHIRCHKDADGRLGPSKLIHDALKFLIVHPAIHGLNGIGRNSQIFLKILHKKPHGLYSLCKNNDTVIILLRIPSIIRIL